MLGSVLTVWHFKHTGHAQQGLLCVSVCYHLKQRQIERERDCIIVQFTPRPKSHKPVKKCPGHIFTKGLDKWSLPPLNSHYYDAKNNSVVGKKRKEEECIHYCSIFFLIDTLFSMDTINWLKMTVNKYIFNVTKMSLFSISISIQLSIQRILEKILISKNMKQHKLFLTLMIIRNALWAPN